MKNYLAVCFICTLFFAACFSPWEGDVGTFTINIGGGSSRAAWLPEGVTELGQLTHTITVVDSSNRQQKRENITYGSAVSFSVATGPCNISVFAYLEKELKAEGFTTVNIVRGSNGSVSVQMGPPGDLIIDPIEFANPTETKTYGDPQFTNAVLPGYNGSGAITYYSAEPSVASVDIDTGEVSIHNAGITVISAIKASSANHAGARAEYTLIINKALLTVKADDEILNGGDPAPAYTYAISGFVNNDNESVISGEPELSSSYSPPMTGSYPITVTQGTLSAQNYDFNMVNGTVFAGLSNQATLTIDDPGPKTYGDASFTLNVSGGSGTGAVTYLIISGNDVIDLIGDTVTILKAGPAVLGAKKAGDNSFNPIDSSPLSITVNQRNLSNADVSVSVSYTYTGNECTPGPTVTDGTLIKESDYILSYSNNTSAGTATVIITATAEGNYTGTNSANFTIAKANPTGAWPSGLTASIGQILLDVSLAGFTSLGGIPGTFSWTEGNNTSVGDIGERIHNMTFTPDNANYNIVRQDITIVIANYISINITNPTNSLTPIVNGTYNERTVEFNIIIPELTGTEMVTVGLASNSYGLTMGEGRSVGISGATLTLNYDGTTEVTSINPVSVGLTVSTNGYSLSGNPEVSVNIFSGRAMGEQAIPVTESNITHFNAYANTTAGLTRHYVLAGDVTLTAPAANESNWTAIGNNTTNAFTGSFDGGGFAISGLIVNNPGSDNQGLFSYMNGNGTTTGIIKNLGLTGVSVMGATGVGSVVGSMSGGCMVENCYAMGSVEGNNFYTGGLVGFSGSGTVENCYFIGSVEGKSDVGGVVGCSSVSAKVENCYFTGNIKGNESVGGVVGYNTYSCAVQNCYSTGSVEGNESVGGVVGRNNDPGMIQNCYSTNSVIGNKNVSGILGSGNYNTVQNCVALNPSITRSSGSEIQFGRIIGSFYASLIINNNYAWDEMKFYDAATLQVDFPTPVESNASGINGADLSAANAITKAAWEAAGFSFGDASPWAWDDDGINMPSLQDVGTAQPWPDHL